MDFINEAEKKEHGMFKGLFDEPDFILEAKEEGFDGSFNLGYREDWFKEHREEELNETCAKIWNDVYNLKDNEKVSIGFVLIQKDAMLGHPLEDYLDSFQIAYAMANAVKRYNANQSSEGYPNMSPSPRNQSGCSIGR